MSRATDTYLAIDIGGTKTVVALYQTAGAQCTVLESLRYRSAEYGGIEEIIEHFLSGLGYCPESVILGVAGVASDTRARVTNLPWVITKPGLHDLGFSTVALINDMTALAASLPLLEDSDLLCLQDEGTPSGEVTAVLAPGTGLGEGFLFQADSEAIPRGTEGGHCDFGPAGEEQLNLFSWLGSKGYRRPCYETVCAGPAIGRLYDFYVAQGEKGDLQVQEEMSRAADRTPVVISAALSGACPLCRKVVDLFLSILGREGANLVMKVYATRGLFLGGGILPRLAGKVSFKPFLTAFRQEGPMAELLHSIPVNVILRQDAVLLGVASFGRGLLRKSRSL